MLLATYQNLSHKTSVMSTRSLIKPGEKSPSLFDDFFKPWNEWFGEGNMWGRVLTTPAVNIIESKDSYEVTMAVPGMKKEDFKIDVDGKMLTISAEIQTTKELKDEKYTRKEYNFNSFSRSFTLPEEIQEEKIVASYENGLLKIILPCSERFKKITSKHIVVR